MTLNAWTGLQDPATPQNIREGEPYNDPQFEELARTYGVWGTAQSALCAEFWQAARRAPAVPADALEKAKKYDHLLPYLCKTCGGFGLVDRRCQGDPLGAEPCPDCNSPAAPVPQGWKMVPVEATDDMEVAAENEYEQKPSYFPDWKSAYSAMLAAAPQPPEADSNSPEFDGIKTEAAPVQMPEPAGCVVYANGELHHLAANRECAELFASSERSRGAPYAFTFENLYTEQQVRQLLAAHGIGKDKA